MSCRLSFLAIFILFSSQLFPFCNPYTYYVEKTYGSEQVSETLESYIRSLAEEMGIKRNFAIKQMSMHSLRTMGAENAFCYPGHLFVHEPFINMLKAEEKKFLLAHELTHLLHRDSDVRIAVQAAYALCFLGAFYSLYTLRNNTLRQAVVLGSYIAATVGLLSWHKKKIHAQEFRADENAIKACQGSQGGELFLQRLAQYNPNSMHADSITHPSISARLDAIKKSNFNQTY